MTDVALTAVPPVLSQQRLNDQFMVQRANKADLPEVLDIYNQSIAGKKATAHLDPVTYEEREIWFDEHLNNPSRPIYVVRATVKSGADDIAGQTKSPIVAWGSYSDLYARTAYHISTEISIYLHQDYHGKGLGSLVTSWMLAQASSLGIKNVVALIFAHNKPSLGLFHKLGFEQWGYMPQVCDMQGFIADVVMLGKSVTANKDS
ncbi:GNAT family N-acetyltransferase [Psychrobacter sp.]|uniref:GNAT family N-acetyltransferase n=1 Tax=Psychrobacter sp. TaxID=56811 RepID=UPI002648F357|nr:GNAT family N-acetyltransferase [Psychrobacter sp.]MDN6275249.1 N-acetyltransferase family protein [Psychrobacter sp.]MDN6308967.1 N-acetyltransferase family protein [Psychrobacter sp.]